MGSRLDKCEDCEYEIGYKNLFKCEECGMRFCENCMRENSGLCFECDNERSHNLLERV